MFRTIYSYDRNQASVETGLVCGRSRTQQGFKEECDINTLVERFGLGYQMPENFRRPTYGDFSDVYDFHSAANAIAQARETFESLPAHLRERFANDPGRFVDFCNDPESIPELQRMGLIRPEAVYDREGRRLSMPPAGAAPGTQPGASTSPGGASNPPLPAKQESGPGGNPPVAG